MVSLAGLSRNNLHRTMHAILKRAGIEPFERCFQVLRQSCETEWSEGFPQHAVSAWLGHSEAVSREELHRVYQKLRRLRLTKYAKAMATHPFQMDLAEYGRAKLVEWGYRLKSAVTHGSAPINAGLE